MVDGLEEIGKSDKETLVLLKLEVKNDLLEVIIQQFGALLVSTDHLIVELFTGHLFLRLACKICVLTSSKSD
jgi:ubiquitin C-terminal hydrolase